MKMKMKHHLVETWNKKGDSVSGEGFLLVFDTIVILIIISDN